MTDAPYQPRSLGEDMLYGAQEIADFLGCSREKVYRLARNRRPDRIPVFTQGANQLCARKSTLYSWTEKREQHRFDF